MSRRDQLADNLSRVDARIAEACTRSGRRRDDVSLIVVTKTYPRSDVELLARLGVTDVGENRHPEASQKVVDGVRLHFIGGLQTNKAAAVARYADVVESVDRPKLVDALARGAAAAERPVSCLVQVDFRTDDYGLDGTGRSGCHPAEAAALADRISGTEGLQLGGVMTVAPLGVDPVPAFESLAALAEQIRRNHPQATVVSAGMSDDFEAAISCGATHLRVGRLVLGERVALG